MPPVKPMIALYRYDKSLVSNFFHCKTGINNKYLVTKRLLNYYDKNTGEYFGAVQVFGFKNEHEILWGDIPEFQLNKEIIRASSQYIVELGKIAVHLYENKTYI